MIPEDPLPDHELSSLFSDMSLALRGKTAETKSGQKHLNIISGMLQATALALALPSEFRAMMKSSVISEISLRLPPDIIEQLLSFGRSQQPPLGLHEAIAMCIGRSLATAGYFMPPSAEDSFLDRGQEVGVLIPTDLLVRLDLFVLEQGYVSRSDALIDALISVLPDDPS